LAIYPFRGAAASCITVLCDWALVVVGTVVCADPFRIAALVAAFGIFGARPIAIRVAARLIDKVADS